MIKNGIDVSEWQGVIDFEKLKGQVDFVIIRAGYGRLTSQIDKQFERNYSECKRLGIPCGAYWYSYAESEADAKAEAAAALEILDGKKLDYPVYYDIEEKKTIGTGKVDNIIAEFCTALEKGGYYSGLYMSRSPLKAYVSPKIRERFALWIAEYGAKCNYDGYYGMWQRSSEGKFDGINGKVDVNECYYDYPAAINPPAKVQKQVTITIDDHTYSGLLTED